MKQLDKVTHPITKAFSRQYNTFDGLVPKNFQKSSVLKYPSIFADGGKWWD